MTSAPAARKAAVLDDDESFQDFLKSFLGLHGYSVHAYGTAGALLDGAARLKPDLILLDIELPHISGWEILKTLRSLPDFKRTPIVLVTGKHRTSKEVVKGLELGADDYFTKPVEPDVMLARVEALLRRRQWQGQEPPPAGLKLGGLVVEPAQRSARIAGRELGLTRQEFDLLVFLLENPDRVHTRAALIEKVWKEGGQGRSVDKYVEYLRKKLGPLGKKIETVVGVGYILRTS